MGKCWGSIPNYGCRKLKNKHILVIDDVVTTGSTLESCAHTLQKIKGIKVSIVTIGSCLMLYLLI